MSNVDLVLVQCGNVEQEIYKAKKRVFWMKVADFTQTYAPVLVGYLVAVVVLQVAKKSYEDTANQK